MPTEINPIGIFHSPFKHALEAPRQATHTVPNSFIELFPEFRPGLQDLDGFSHLWVIFSFHLKEQWRPLVQPPRGSAQKRGVFATRSPLRPNHLGLSCLELDRIEGGRVYVRGADLLDETPIFDIKPYLVYADSVPGARSGWLEGIERERHRISWAPEAERQKLFLAQNGIYLQTVVENQLEHDPTNAERKRVYPAADGRWIFAYRTWRIEFEVRGEHQIYCHRVFSGYTPAELKSGADKYHDQKLHREYAEIFK